MTRRTLILVVLAVASLSGCGGDNADLERYVAEVKARKAASIEPIPEIAAYEPYTYRAQDRRAPFTPTMPEPERSNSSLAPNLNREREPLEAYPLDALRMVGTISRSGVTFALIQAPDNVVYRVTRGNHLGQNYGEITAVSGNGIALTEIVPDGMGGYDERPAAIAPSR